MNTPRSFRFLPFLAGLSLLACRDSTPTALLDPALDATEEAVVLRSLEDPAATMAALEVAQVTAGAPAYRHGRGMRGRQDPALEQTRARFQEAIQAHREGRDQDALALAHRARRSLGDAVAGHVGPRGVTGLVERLEALALQAGWEGDPFGLGLGRDLELAAHRARNALRAGDPGGAAGWAMLGEQLRRRQHNRECECPGGMDPERATVWVGLGATAIDLATRLIGEDAGDEQLRFLATAEEFQAAAEEALDAEAYSRAMHLAHLAEWAALKAVVLPDGVTDEEARAMLELAEELYEAAEAAVGDEPTEIEAWLLDRAARLLDVGTDRYEAGIVRGIAALWQSAVVSTSLIG